MIRFTKCSPSIDARFASVMNEDASDNKKTIGEATPRVPPFFQVVSDVLTGRTNLDHVHGTLQEILHSPESYPLP